MAEKNINNIYKKTGVLKKFNIDNDFSDF